MKFLKEFENYIHSFKDSPIVVCGDFNDFTSVYNFGKDCDIITFEIEHINVDALERLENEGKRVFHKSKTLRIIQDKNLRATFASAFIKEGFQLCHPKDYYLSCKLVFNSPSFI